MTESNKQKLQARLKYLGLSAKWVRKFFQEFNIIAVTSDSELVFQNVYPQKDMQYDLHFTKQAGEIVLLHYDATLKIDPLIEHKVVNGIDTGLLQQLMNELDWQYDYRLLEQRAEHLTAGEAVAFNNYVKVIACVIMLAANDEGQAISDAFRMTYFKDTPYEKRFLNDSIKKRFNRRARFFLQVPDPVTFEQARTLLKGRYVLEGFTDNNNGNESEWIRIGQDDEAFNCTPSYVSREQYSEVHDLIGALKKLPLLQKDIGRLELLQQELYQGKQVNIALGTPDRQVSCYIEAAPEQKGLLFLDEHHNPATLAELLALIKKKPDTKRKKGNGPGHSR